MGRNATRAGDKSNLTESSMKTRAGVVAGKHAPITVVLATRYLDVYSPPAVLFATPLCHERWVAVKAAAAYPSTGRRR